MDRIRICSYLAPEVLRRIVWTMYVCVRLCESGQWKLQCVIYRSSIHQITPNLACGLRRGSSKASHSFAAKSVDASWRHVASKVCPMLKYSDIMTTYIYATIAHLCYDVTTVIYDYKQICDHKRGWMPIKEWKFMCVLMFVWLGRLWAFTAVTYVAHTEDMSHCKHGSLGDQHQIIP